METRDLTAFSTSAITALSTAQARALVASQVAALTTSQVMALTSAQISGLTTASLNALTTAQFASLRTTHIAALTTAQIAGLESADLASLTSAQVAAITTASIAALSTTQIVAFTTAQAAALIAAQVSKGLNTVQLAAMETRDLAALSTSAIAALTTAQAVRGLGTSQLRAFTTEQVAALSKTVVQALTTEQISLGLDTAQWAALTTGSIAALTTTQISQGLTTDQIVALTTAQVARGLVSSQVAAMTTAQVAAMETRDIAALTTTQVAKGLTTAQISALTSAQVCAMTTEQVAALPTAQAALISTKTPIVLDLNHDGISTLNITAGVQFDLGADGTTEHTGWVSSSDGLLVMDRNRDGSINDGSELFGSSTTLADGSKAPDGYVALAELDVNHDGIISAADAGFADLQVWVDANSDGVSTGVELKSMASLGIASLSLTTQRTAIVDHGNTLGLVSSFQTTDGASHAAADVWFQTLGTPPPAAPVASPADLGARVSGLVQAMVAHETAMASERQPSATRSIGAQTLAFSNSQTLASASALSNAMQQFDACGTPVLAHASLAGPMGADPARKPQMTDPLAAAMLVTMTVKG